jgi:murein DD-endopeptidase MepM/ murein hydrolase activator NlpD
MRPRHTVPATRFVKLHGPSPQGKLAADVYANHGNIVLAPADGRVVFADCPDSPHLPGCQFKGFLTLADGREMGFVLAHLIPGTFVQAGQTFRKGQVIGKMAFWEQHPKSTHVHWSFKHPGTGMPPKANIPVMTAFSMLGLPPPRTLNKEAVPHFVVEESAQLAEEDRLAAQESEHEAIPTLEEE